MDNHFLLSGIESSFPWLYILLSRLPIPAIQYFFASRPRLAQVGAPGYRTDQVVQLTDFVLQYGKDSFESYVKEYGRDSGRRDLLTKVLSVKPATGESVLTDRETYMEVSNLVFAGTGRHSRSWSTFTNTDSGSRHHKHDSDVHVLGACTKPFMARSAPQRTRRASSCE